MTRPLRKLRGVLRTRLTPPRPIILSHLVTGRCNAACPTCLWRRPESSRSEELSTRQIEAIYDDAGRCGFVSLVVWGGEPLIRSDTPDLLKAAHERPLDVTLITNGWALQEKSESLAGVTDRLMVSIDAIGERHDELRGCPGLFRRLSRGLDEIRSRRPRLPITVISLLTTANLDQIEPLGRLVGRWRASIVFQALDEADAAISTSTPRFPGLIPDPAQRRRAAAAITRLRQAGIPAQASRAYLDQIAGRASPYRCHYRKVLLRLESDGKVRDCTDGNELADLRTARLSEVLSSPSYRRFLRRAESCHRCLDAGVVEISRAWAGNLSAVRSVLGTAFSG